MEDTFDGSKLAGEVEFVFDHSLAQAYFGASVFWIRRMAAIGGEEDFVEYWQATREHSRRGIVEVTGRW